MQYLLVSSPRGELRENRLYHALGRAGPDHYAPLGDDDVVPLPEGSALHFLPGRLPRGRHIKRNRFSSADSFDAHLMAAAAVLPPGWARTHVPAWHRTKGAPPLPFFSYAALSFQGESLWVSAVRLEDDFRWSPSQYDSEDLPGKVERALEEHPSNRLLAHLSRCALAYHCYTAQNIFYSRWEGGVPTSPACNASCYGCLSCQEGGDLPSPQERIAFTPSVDEVVEVAAGHLAAPDSIVSFGQGCEGEPSLQADLLEECIRAIRAKTGMGTLNMNTNGSRPEAMERLFDAGLDSVRVSLCSALKDDYESYFRPRGYGFEEVLRTLAAAGDRGKSVSLNLLTLPGFTDRQDQVEALVALIRSHRIRKVQVRDLNGDPDILYKAFAREGAVRGKRLGIREMLAELKRELPGLEVGSFNPPAAKP